MITLLAAQSSSADALTSWLTAVGGLVTAGAGIGAVWVAWRAQRQAKESMDRELAAHRAWVAAESRLAELSKPATPSANQIEATSAKLRTESGEPSQLDLKVGELQQELLRVLHELREEEVRQEVRRRESAEADHELRFRLWQQLVARKEAEWQDEYADAEPHDPSPGPGLLTLRELGTVVPIQARAGDWKAGWLAVLLALVAGGLATVLVASFVLH